MLVKTYVGQSTSMVTIYQDAELDEHTRGHIFYDRLKSSITAARHLEPLEHYRITASVSVNVNVCAGSSSPRPCRYPSFEFKTDFALFFWVWRFALFFALFGLDC
jgi:hypothetical protein